MTRSANSQAFSSPGGRDELDGEECDANVQRGEEEENLARVGERARVFFPVHFAILTVQLVPPVVDLQVMSTRQLTVELTSPAKAPVTLTSLSHQVT